MLNKEINFGENSAATYNGLDKRPVVQTVDHNSYESSPNPLNYTPELPSAVNSSDSLSTIPSPSSTNISSHEALAEISYLNRSTLTLNQLERFQKDQEEGVIHGHIHNFAGFTYIHGHIHTNDAHDASSSITSASNVTASNTNENHHIPSYRSNNHHSHPNDTHASKFTDCQHFEFLNCHDNLGQGTLIIEDMDLKCKEDENCKPKIMEICCEDQHPILPSQQTANPNFNIPSFQTNLPPCSTNAVLPSQFSGAFPNGTHLPEALKFSQCEENGTGSGVDLDCGLDTCKLDDLCRFCDEIGIPYPEGSDNQVPSNKRQREEESLELKQESTDQSHSHSHTQLHSHHHQHSHETGHSHHLHHHNHSHEHSENHHHHHIQLHDHQQPTKKQKSAESHSTELINFAWNFNNQTKTCEWNDCGLILNNPILLQHHIMQNHLVALPQSTDPLVESEGYVCEWKDCDYLGDDLFQLVNHINCTHSTQKSVGVDELSTSDYSANKVKRTDLKPPVAIKTDIQTPVLQQGCLVGNKGDKDDTETKCKWSVPGEPPCTAEFKTGAELTQHILNDHVGSGKSSYVCYWAGCDRNHKVFSQRQKIIRHLHVHTKYKPFHCEICGHNFITEAILDQHMRTHSGEKPFVCKTCGKAFARSSSLSIHNRVHTGEKPLVCKHRGCGKRFSESSNLTKHMKTHEKNFKCSKCGKGFAKHKQLAIHTNKCSGSYYLGQDTTGECSKQTLTDSQMGLNVFQHIPNAAVGESDGDSSSNDSLNQQFTLNLHISNNKNSNINNMVQPSKDTDFLPSNVAFQSTSLNFPSGNGINPEGFFQNKNNTNNNDNGKNNGNGNDKDNINNQDSNNVENGQY